MKIFIIFWIITSIIFFFFQPLNYFNPCYGKKCMDYDAPAILSMTPNFIQPACRGFCNAELNKTVFEATFLIVDIFSGLVVSLPITALVKKLKRKNNVA